MKINEIKRKAVNKAKKLLLRLADVFGGPYTFLRGGRTGGIFLCEMLAAQFVYGSFLWTVGRIITAPAAFGLGAVAVVLGVELVTLLIRLIFGGKRRSLISFLTAAGVIAASAFAAAGGSGILPALLVGAAAGLAADMLGRCVWSIAVGKNRRSSFGYISGAAALAVLAAFAVFYHLPGFGEDMTAREAAMTAPAAQPAEGFADYLRGGDGKVTTLTYGPSEDDDITAEPFYLTKYASRDGILGWMAGLCLDYPLSDVPVRGAVWMPEQAEGCPVLFIIHGNHDLTVDSYLGYDYLGEYLARCGYVVVSVDENCCNELSNENDARAVLLLENIRLILAENEDEESPLFGAIDPDRIALAGHSRGGEAAATACLFNWLEAYPDNGTVRFNYRFNIRALIAIAPSVDQYMPAGHAVEVENVSYLLIHGANDQDVTSVCGEKQYANVAFTDGGEHIKASVFILGANHGQFNTRWGRYDQSEGLAGFLNTKDLISAEGQQTCAKAFIRAFLDKTLNGDDTYADLLRDAEKYSADLPDTVYVQSFMPSGFEPISSFDGDADIIRQDMDGVTLVCFGMRSWGEQAEVHGKGGDGENYVLHAKWKNASNASMKVQSVSAIDMTQRALSFRIADMREEENAQPLRCTVTLIDAAGNEAVAADAAQIIPAPAVRLYKTDFLSGKREYKHQMCTVTAAPDAYSAKEGFMPHAVMQIRISFDGTETGEIILDDLGFMPVQ